jgi:5-methylcytosine-specific restriction protein A
MAAPTHAQTQRAKRRRATDRHRGSASERGYDARWQAARRWYLNQNPLCRACESQGYYRMANEVDHIVPFKGDDRLKWDQDNWQPLCKSCHSRKSAKESGGWKKVR